MQTITTQPSASPFALLMDRDAIRAAIGRAARLDLPRRECRPLDRYTGKRVSIDVARYDEEVETTGLDLDDCDKLIQDDVLEAGAADDGYIEGSELDDEIDIDCFDEEDDNY
jgi:hypothetical protein